MDKSKQSERDLSYLSGVGVDAPQKEDIKAVIRPLEYTEIEGEVENEEQLVDNIHKNEGKGEIKRDEFVILERKVESKLVGFDFYIARRQRSGKVFEPETVLVAKRNNREHYVQKLREDISDEYDILQEKDKLLTNKEIKVLDESIGVSETDAGDLLTKNDETIGIGSMSKISHTLLRGQSKFIPESTALREKIWHYGDEANEKEVCSIVGKLRDIDPDMWNYIVKPVDSVKGEIYSAVWELISSDKDGDLEVENLEKSLMSGDSISFQKKLVIIRQLFEALSTTAKLGVYHRDIKPANIVLTDEGIKLCDFGIMNFEKRYMDSKYLKKANNLPERFDANNTPPGYICGTAVYLHRRILSNSFPKGDREINNPRYDVYAASLTAIELITNGKTDFSAFLNQKLGISLGLILENSRYVAYVSRVLDKEISIYGQDS